jgi:hypothetical protein
MIWSYILNIHAYDMIIHIESTWIWHYHAYRIYMNMILPVRCRHRAARSYILNIHEYDMIIHIESTWIWYDHTYWIYMNMKWSYILNIDEHDIARRMSPSRSAIIHIEYTWIRHDHTYWIYMHMIWSYILNIHEYDMIIHIEYTWIWYYPSDVAIARRERHCLEPKSCVRCLIFAGHFFAKEPCTYWLFCRKRPAT